MRSRTSTRFSSSIAADASAGTRPDGGVPAGIGAVFAGAVASAGAVLSDGAAGAYRAGQVGQAFVRQVGREGREPIGRASVRQSVMCLEVDRAAIGQEVVGRAAVMPEPVVRAAAGLVAAAALAAAVVVAAAAVAVAAAVVVAAAADPALTPVF